MSTQLILSLVLNTVVFGLMGFSRNRLGITVPRFLKNNFVGTFLTVIYFSSFILILLSPGNLVLKILIALLMQFLINHIIWGSITGLIAGRKTRKNKKLE